jgi:SpoVK/Ycf46/Vps4 family AAA+-type ATPase
MTSNLDNGKKPNEGATLKVAEAEQRDVGRKIARVDPDVNIDQLADDTDGYTGADIASLSSAAVMLALREHVSKYKDPKEAEEHKEELKIHRTHFEEAMKKIRPLSMQELNMYKTVSEQFGKPQMSRAVAADKKSKDVYV